MLCLNLHKQFLNELLVIYLWKEGNIKLLLCSIVLHYIVLEELRYLYANFSLSLFRTNLFNQKGLAVDNDFNPSFWDFLQDISLSSEKDLECLQAGILKKRYIKVLNWRVN